MLCVFEDFVDNCGLRSLVQVPRRLAMNLVEVWASVWELIARDLAIELGLRIAFEHVSDLDSSVCIMSLFSPAHDLQGCLRRFVLSACKVSDIDATQRGYRVIQSAAPVPSQRVKSWLTQGRALPVHRG